MAINNDVKWIKFDPRESYATMARMTLEERGAYATLFDAACIHDGSLPDDIKVLSKIMGIDRRMCRRLRQRLLDLEAIYVHGTFIYIDRVYKAVAQAKDRIQSASNAGLCSAAKRNADRKDNNDLVSTGVKRAFRPTSTPRKILSLDTTLDGFGKSDLQPKKRISDLSLSELEEIHRRRKTSRY